MALSLKQLNAIQALAHAVRDFLPGSGARVWGKGHITFGSVATKVGVAEFWGESGSKAPRLTHLFEQTLIHRQRSFEPLIVGIVKEGLSYRSKTQPITTAEIKIINGHILDIGFRFPDLWDPAFLNALTVDDVTRARQNVAAVERDEENQTSARERQLRSLNEMKVDLEALFIQADRQDAGLKLETLLNRLFALYDLTPREPFRVVGEQIDGSFELDHDVYLLEAKWENKPMSEKELLVFRGKIEGKSSFTRGLFLAMNGITKEAATALLIGKQPTFFVVTGHDLMMLLNGAMPLDRFLRARRRLLGEEAAILAAFDRVVD